MTKIKEKLDKVRADQELINKDPELKNRLNNIMKSIDQRRFEKVIKNLKRPADAHGGGYSKKKRGRSKNRRRVVLRLDVVAEQKLDVGAL